MNIEKVGIVLEAYLPEPDKNPLFKNRLFLQRAFEAAQNQD